MAFDCPIPRLSAWEYMFLEGVYKAPSLEKLFGMNVAVLPFAQATFLTMYLKSMTSSAACSSELNW